MDQWEQAADGPEQHGARWAETVGSPVFWQEPFHSRCFSQPSGQLLVLTKVKWNPTKGFEFALDHRHPPISEPCTHDRNESDQFRLTVYNTLTRELEDRTRYPMTCYTQESCTLKCPDVNIPPSNYPNFTSRDITWHKVFEIITLFDTNIFQNLNEWFKIEIFELVL